MVTHQHIADAKKTAFFNPIALAANKFDDCAVVTKRSVHLQCGVFGLPAHAQSWLADYYGGRTVYPMSLTLIS